MKLLPTNVTLVTMRFHWFFCRFPLFMTRKTSSSACGLTCRIQARLNTYSCRSHDALFWEGFPIFN